MTGKFDSTLFAAQMLKNNLNKRKKLLKEIVSSRNNYSYRYKITRKQIHSTHYLS